MGTRVRNDRIEGRCSVAGRQKGSMRVAAIRVGFGTASGLAVCDKCVSGARGYVLVNISKPMANPSCS